MEKTSDTIGQKKLDQLSAELQRVDPDAEANDGLWDDDDAAALTVSVREAKEMKKLLDAQKKGVENALEQ